MTSPSPAALTEQEREALLKALADPMLVEPLADLLRERYGFDSFTAAARVASCAKDTLAARLADSRPAEVEHE